MVERRREAGDIAKLEDLARTMAAASLCGLGQAAAGPCAGLAEYFRDEYTDLIDQSLFLRSYLAANHIYLRRS
jgi:NADH:ubiquinone oxidoreductase subunit F (NADH-binding)